MRLSSRFLTPVTAIAILSLVACGDDAAEVASTPTATPALASAPLATNANGNPIVRYLPQDEVIEALNEAARSQQTPLANTWEAGDAYDLPGKTSGGKSVLLLAGFSRGDTFLSPINGEVKEVNVSDGSAGYSVMSVVILSNDHLIGFEAGAGTESAVYPGKAVFAGDPLLRLDGQNIPEQDNLSRLAQIAIFDITEGGATAPAILTQDGFQIGVAQ